MSEAVKDDGQGTVDRLKAERAEKLRKVMNGNVVPINPAMASQRSLISGPAPKEEPRAEDAGKKAVGELIMSLPPALREDVMKALNLKRVSREGIEARRRKPAVEVRSDFLLPTFTYSDARTSLEKSLAALRTFGVSFRYDRFRNQLLVGDHVLKQLVGESVEHHILMLRYEINKQYGWEAKPEVTKAAVVRLCLENSFNPVIDYLDSLEWDSEPRIDTWLSVYLGAEDNQLNRAVGRKVLIAAVRRVREPGTKFDQIIVLEGEQGTGKSTAIMILFSEEYYSDAEILSQSGREVMEQTTGVWGYELSELEGIGKRDVAHVKAFARRQFDRARPAYGHALEKRGRTCIFIGTTNSKDYLADETGNRAFWPVVTGAIDLDALRRDRDQLWAEAVEAEKSGETLIIDRALWGEAAAVVGDRLPDDPWQDILAKVEGMPNAGGSLERADGYIKVTTEFLLTGVLHISPEKVSQTHTKRLARVMERLGWEKPDNVRIGSNVAKGYRKPVE